VPDDSILFLIWFGTVNSQVVSISNFERAVGRSWDPPSATIVHLQALAHCADVRWLRLCLDIRICNTLTTCQSTVPAESLFTDAVLPPHVPLATKVDGVPMPGKFAFSAESSIAWLFSAWIDPYAIIWLKCDRGMFLSSG